MGEDIKIYQFGEDSRSTDGGALNSTESLIALADSLLLDTSNDLIAQASFSVPIAQLSTLGAGVSSLLPALRTVTQTTTIDAEGLYRLANASVGDALKPAKDGNFFGALKTAQGGSKMARLQSAGQQSLTTKTTMPINPATMMMAVALFSIEQQLKGIAETGQQILSFIETEKESEIEADMQVLINIINQYKNNWDNEHYISSNHQIVLDIKRTARKHMNSYLKKVSADLEKKEYLVPKSKMTGRLTSFQKNFKYYRLSLYIFSMASLIEIMLSGNFKEEFIEENILEIEKLSLEYRNVFGECSKYLERIASCSLEANVLKGIGYASNTVGKLIGDAPIVNKSSVDEFLVDSSDQLKHAAKNIELESISAFAKFSNPETSLFTEKMRDMVRIYNHTTQICFDDENIYLIA